MINVNDVPAEQLLVTQYTAGIRYITDEKLEYGEWLAHALRSCFLIMATKLMFRGISFDAVAETEIWFEDNPYPDVTVKMIAVTKQGIG